MSNPLADPKDLCYTADRCFHLHPCNFTGQNHNRLSNHRHHPRPQKEPCHLLYLKDLSPVARTPLIMMHLQRRVLVHIQSSTHELLEPLQYGYCPNRCSEAANSAALLIALSLLENMLTSECSSSITAQPSPQTHK